MVLLATLVLACIGFWNLMLGARQRRALVARTALDEVEAKASRVLVRLDAHVRRTRLGGRLAVRLAAAGVPFTATEFALLVAGLATAAFMVADVLLARLLAPLASLAAVRGCWGWVRHKQAQRQEVFIGQLPEVARVLSNAASAGLALRTAIEMAAAEVDEPAATELRYAAESLRLGRSVEQALTDLEARLPSRELGVLVSTLVIQHRTGGGLVSALRNMAETLDARKDLRREMRTLMSGSVFTGYIVAAMGVGTLFLLNLLSPGLLDQVTTSGVGRLALVFSGTLYAVGLILIRRLTRIET